MIAVPNVSTNDLRVTEAMLDVHRDPDHRRSVITFAGAPEIVLGACLELTKWAVEHVRLDEATGVHPRFGALDVLPLVPYGTNESKMRSTANELRREIESLGVPVYTYGRAHPEQRSLPELRRYLRATPHPSHSTAGVVCLGIRDPLVAFNVNFRGDIQAVRQVAKDVRAPGVRALGFELASRGLVQVSMNLIAPDRLGPKAAFRRVLTQALETDLELVDCEVVGLVPHTIVEQLEGLPLRAPVRSIEQALAEKGID